MNKNSIHWNKTKTKMNIRHRQDSFKRKLRNAKQRLRIHLKKPHPLYWQLDNKISQDHILQVICNGLHIFIENSL